MLAKNDFHLLKITDISEDGMTVELDEGNTLFISNKWSPIKKAVGEEVKVYLYENKREELAGTTLRPYVSEGKFGYLKVKSVNGYGAFFDWGLPKDLFVPASQFYHEPIEGHQYVVHVTRDDSNRLMGSLKLNKFVDLEPAEYKNNDPVSLLITDETDLGFMAIINQKHWGLLHHSEIFKPVYIGDKKSGFIKKVREDGKIDLTLQAKGYEKVGGIAEQVINHLIKQGGSSPISDKSPPEVIYNAFGISKRAYKMAIGTLYKNKLITIDKTGITLVE
jgi:uncharacterized protein